MVGTTTYSPNLIALQFGSKQNIQRIFAPLALHEHYVTCEAKTNTVYRPARWQPFIKCNVIISRNALAKKKKRKSKRKARNSIHSSILLSVFFQSIHSLTRHSSR